jgi:multidrug efflux pump subunit AcrB
MDQEPNQLLSDAPPVANHKQEKTPWFRRLSRPILFLTITLALVGVYLAFSIPVAVFPNTDFPRIVVGVDNGVMPIDQMLVTITRPIEEAVNSVPGLSKVYSITSRGSAEVDLFFDWKSDMILTLQRVDAVMARLQTELPATAKIETHRLTFATFPIVGYSLTSDTIPQTRLWEIATYDLKPRINRLEGVASVLIQGGRVPEFHVIPDPARLPAAGITVTDLLDAIRRTRADEPRPSVGSRAGERTSSLAGADRPNCRENTCERRSDSHCGHRHNHACGSTRLYHRYGGRKAGCAYQREPPARKQHATGRQ